MEIRVFKVSGILFYCSGDVRITVILFLKENEQLQGIKERDYAHPASRLQNGIMKTLHVL